MSLTLILILIFLIGIAFVALEEKVGVNKSATALLMSVIMWVAISIHGVPVGAEIVAEQLGDVSETLFFVMGALLIVELVDVHGGFRVISDRIVTRNKRKLLWVVSFITFFLSVVLDNIATSVIIIAILRKLVPEVKDRWTYAGMVIIAANAGGSFSPVGDVTTILLWNGGNVTPMHQITTLFLPALTCMMLPLLVLTKLGFKRGEVLPPIPEPQNNPNSLIAQVSNTSRTIILFLGISTMALVPFFAEWSILPPFMHILLGVSLLWIYTDKMYGKMGALPERKRMTVTNVISRIDMSTIMFFLGVLMSVAAMKVAGSLSEVGGLLESAIDEPLLVSFVIGAMSSFVDNVALVAATQGMYPIAEVGTYMADSSFWTFLAYCSVTGGSLLIIGSATGVTVMGMEKLSFGYYLKRFSILALLGYVGGAAVYILL